MKVESELGINNAEEILKLQLELDTLKTLIGEKSSLVEVEEKVIHVNHELEAENETVARSSDLKESLLHELKDTKAVIEALETQQVISLNELDDLQDCNDKYAVLLRTQEQEISMLRKQLGEQFEGEGRLSFAHEDKKDLSPKNVSFDNSPLQVKLKRMQASVDMVCSLNMRYQSDKASQTSIEQEMEEICRQVEIETTEVIVCLQEELTALQQQASVSNQNELLAKNRLSAIETENKELHERLSLVAKDNDTLTELLGEKEAKLRPLTEDWESFASQIIDVLANGCTSLEDASDQISSISHSVPQRIWISEKVGRMMRNISERDALIEEIQKCLEDAHKYLSCGRCTRM